MKRLAVLLAFLAAALSSAFPAQAQTGGGSPISYLYCYISGSPTSPVSWGPCDSGNPLPVSASVTASISGFTPTPSYGTPLSVSNSTARTALPTGAVVIAYNVGANPAYCAIGSNSVNATTSDDYIPSGGWLAYTVGAAVDIACITASSTTTVNTSGGAGLPTGTGGLPVGAATAANQATEISSLATIATNTGAAIPDCGSLPCTNKIGALAPLTATSTQTKVTITTAGTYQQYLASNTARKGCTIQFITASHTGYVFFGAAPGDTTTSFQLSPGQTLNCTVGNDVLTDAVQLTSSNNSDVFVVNSY